MDKTLFLMLTLLILICMACFIISREPFFMFFGFMFCAAVFGIQTVVNFVKRKR